VLQLLVEPLELLVWDSDRVWSYRRHIIS
jgi:hypothetical protein